MLNLWGRSLNVVSLAGMAFAVGMLVDNAVVVLENIYRHYQNGEPPTQAAVRGTKEVWGAVLASTLTTLAVFLPVLFVEEEAGQLFRDIALAISAAVGLSLDRQHHADPDADTRDFCATNKSKQPRRVQLGQRIAGKIRRSPDAVFRKRFVDGDRESRIAGSKRPDFAKSAWSSCLLTATGVISYRDVAEGRILAHGKSQSGLRDRASASRLQPGRTDSDGRDRRRCTCSHTGTLIRTVPRPTHSNSPPSSISSSSPAAVPYSSGFAASIRPAAVN